LLQKKAAPLPEAALAYVFVYRIVYLTTLHAAASGIPKNPK